MGLEGVQGVLTGLWLTKSFGSVEPTGGREFISVTSTCTTATQRGLSVCLSVCWSHW